MIDSQILDLLRGGNFAVLTTFLESGDAQSHVMWVDGDQDHVLINTELGRLKERNVSRDPRVTVTVIDKENPYRFAEIRGRVVSTTTGDSAADHINLLSERYNGIPYPMATDRRVILHIEPHHQWLRG